MIYNDFIDVLRTEDSAEQTLLIAKLKQAVQSVYSNPHTNVTLVKIKLEGSFLFLFITKELNGVSAILSNSDSYRDFRAFSITGTESYLLVSDPASLDKDVMYGIKNFIMTEMLTLVKMVDFPEPKSLTPLEQDKAEIDRLTSFSTKSLNLSLGNQPSLDNEK